MILTADRRITKREEKEVLKALKYSWGKNAYKTKGKFEKKFGAFTGFKYNIATSGGTMALALAFSAINLKKGDEVIVPDLCYFSPLDEIVYRGAKPVFVDVLINGCINPIEIEKAITSRTKAIMPVYMYGNLTEAQEIRKIARKHGLYVIDDACPAVGSYYQGKHAGYYSDIACFSFQGAKIVTTGLGGMLSTNNLRLYKRVLMLNRQGESYSRKFWQEEHGFYYSMSDIQAALGIAQLSRIGEILSKKRQIFEWYQSELNQIKIINQDTSNFWMISIIHPNASSLRAYLYQNGVDTRPFFHAASDFPMYKTQSTNMTHFLSKHGINLPSGEALTKKQVLKVCYLIKEYDTKHKERYTISA